MMKNYFYACFDDEEIGFQTVNEAREQIDLWKQEDDENDCNYRIIDGSHEIVEICK